MTYSYKSRVVSCHTESTNSIPLPDACTHLLLTLFRPNTVYTYQALSEEDLELWLDAMDGKEPVYERPLRPSDASQTFLDEAGFNFIQRCIQVLEYRKLFQYMKEQYGNSIFVQGIFYQELTEDEIEQLYI